MKKHIFVCLVWTLMIILYAPYAAKAQDDDADDADGFSELMQEFPMSTAVYIQEKGALQITNNHDYIKGNSLINWKHYTTAIELEYGIIPKLQASLGMGYGTYKSMPYYDMQGILHDNKYKGFTNPEIGIGYSIINKPKIALSAMLETSIPFKSDMASDEFEFEPVLVGAIQLGKAQVHMGISGEWENNKLEAGFDLGGVYDLGAFKPTLEINIHDAQTVTPGIVFGKGIFEASVGVPIVLNNGVTLFYYYDYAILGKLIIEFEL